MLGYDASTRQYVVSARAPEGAVKAQDSLLEQTSIPMWKKAIVNLKHLILTATENI